MHRSHSHKLKVTVLLLTLKKSSSFSWLYHVPEASPLRCFILKELAEVADSTFSPHLSRSPTIFMLPDSAATSLVSPCLTSQQPSSHPTTLFFLKNFVHLAFLDVFLIHCLLLNLIVWSLKWWYIPRLCAGPLSPALIFLKNELIKYHGFKYHYVLVTLKSLHSALTFPLNSMLVCLTTNLPSPLGTQ